MNNEDKQFIKRYEELLDKGYCDCNEMNCIDNNSPRRILNIVKDLREENQRLNNILNELEKWLKVNLINLEKQNAHNIYNEGLKQGMLANGRLIQNKLNELKESDK